MHILLNKYFCCNVFKKPGLYISVCILYDDIVLLKLNGETIMKWLSEQLTPHKQSSLERKKAANMLMICMLINN